MLDLADFRNLFPITERCIYFNHAATGPLSLPARRAIEQCVDIYSSRGEFDIDEYFSKIQDARVTIAHLINAKPEEIAFTHNTSEGIYIALHNLPLVENDTVLVMDEVFPAVRYVVDHNLPGINKKYIAFAGKDPVTVLKSNMTKNVKALVVDYVQFLSGETIDLQRLSEFTSEVGLYLVVDGIQGIGAMSFDAADNNVDFLACGSAKWLFGPGGAGFLYVNRRNFGRLRCQHTGWLGAKWTGFEDITKNPPLHSDARKFEMGTRNVIGIQALSTNINILLQYGMPNVEARIMKLKSILRNYFESSGFRISTPDSGKQSGILTVRPRIGVEDLYHHLKETGVIVSMRNQNLRFSPHFYNSEEEVKQIIDAVKRYRNKG